jgi:transposase
MYGEMRYTERMKPYSQDLRDRVLAAVKETKLSQAKIAKAFKISKSALEKWLRRQHETGACTALPHGGGHPRSPVAKLSSASKLRNNRILRLRNCVRGWRKPKVFRPVPV